MNRKMTFAFSLGGDNRGRDMTIKRGKNEHK
jgi:hypothetical protein